MNFLAGVNRVLRTDGILGGDDDDLASFSEDQHSAALQRAKIAIQDELSWLVSENYIPYERAETTLTTSAGTRIYSLASDFVRFDDAFPWLLEVDSIGESENVYVTEVQEERLRKQILDYREQDGRPYHWYWIPASTKQIGLFPVPESTRYYRYTYEKSIQVSAASDALPFVATDEAYAFLEAASVRFRYMNLPFDRQMQLAPSGIARMPGLEDARARLLSLLNHKRPARMYGRRYG